jgi:hypothetical protein
MRPKWVHDLIITVAIVRPTGRYAPFGLEVWTLPFETGAGRAWTRECLVQSSKNKKITEKTIISGR